MHPAPVTAATGQTATAATASSSHPASRDARRGSQAHAMRLIQDNMLIMAPLCWARVAM